MRTELLEELKTVTPEEEAILQGNHVVDRTIYVSDDTDVFDYGKLMGDERIFGMRTHTRFVHFQKHTHNFIEVIYMCTGSTHHVINGKDVLLQEGELLFLNQCATQEIYPAGSDDVAVNFFILPEFLEYGLSMIETEENPLRDFIVGCLRRGSSAPGYLHFRVADMLPVQNLVENLIWSLRNEQQNITSINQATMGMLFLQLIQCADRLETDMQAEKKLMLPVLSYIEKNYRDGTFRHLAESLHYDLSWLSREIKKQTGMTYTELVQNKRLSQAAYLLTATAKSVLEIAGEVGYSNIAYFHRLFQQRYGVTPKHYRKKR
ncbi:MAG: helix-turn-helix domain-containing protein [Clostridia bacterium]|nr:helix-turn-helix domain-containing protein [Clostridia bacterium]